MNLKDISGHVNGLIILSSLSFVFTQYIQGRQREHAARIDGLVRAIARILVNPTVWSTAAPEQVTARFDAISGRKLGNFGIELISLFVIILGAAATKAGDSIVLSFTQIDGYHKYVLYSVAILSALFFFWLLLAGVHTSVVRTRTQRQEIRVLRFHGDLKKINPNVPDIG